MDFGDFKSGLQDFANIRRTSAQTDLTRQAHTTEILRQELLKEQRTKTDAEAKKTIQDYHIVNELANSQIEAAKLNVDKIKEDILGKQLDNDFKDKSLRDRVESMWWAVRNARAQLTGRKLQNELLELQRQFLNLGLDRNSPWYAKIFGNAIRLQNN